MNTTAVQLRSAEHPADARRALRPRGQGRFWGRYFRGDFRGGFTLVELMVAISIVLIMLFLINQVFFSTSKAVSQGVGLSHIISDSRAMVQQFARDTELMIGPDGKLLDGRESGSLQGGFIIILQKQVMATVPLPNGAEKRRMVRSDQLVFIRPGSEEDPLAPATNNSFTNTNHAPFLRVWYGHARRTDRDGRDDDMDPDRPDDVRSPSGSYLGAPGGPNEVASQWVLARQGLHLFDNGNVGLPTIHFNGGWYHCGTGLLQEDGEAVPRTDELRGYDTKLPNLVVPAMYMGLSDCAYFSYEGDTTHGGMVGGVEEEFQTAPTGIDPWHMPRQRLWSDFAQSDFGISVSGNYDTNPDGEYAEYVRRAYRYTYGIKQLRVNPTPEYRLESSGLPHDQYGYDAWQAAQMHPYLMMGVSDFIVEFAGDYYTNTDLGGAFAPDGLIDVEQPDDKISKDFKGNEYKYGPQDGATTGNIRWYTHWLFANMPHAIGDRPAVAVPTDVTDPAQWPRFDSDQPPTYPFAFGQLTPFPGYEWNQANFETNIGGTSQENGVPHAHAAFVFRHDDEEIDRYPTPPHPFPSRAGVNAQDCLWPYMIRLRWRMHDPTNRIFEPADGEAGKWFEQIIAVPRPR